MHLDFEEGEEPSTALSGVQAAARGSVERSSKAKAASERTTKALAKMLEEADEERKTKRAKTEKE